MLITILLIVAALLVWALWGREWLKSRGWGWSNAFFAWAEPIEIKLWKNSKVIFIARLKMLTGLLLTAGAQAGQINIEPLMPFVPDAWEGAVRVAWNMIPMSLTLLGWMDEYLRKQTTEPLEITAAPEAVKAALPEVQQMQAAKAEAVAAVEVAKAEGGA